MEFWCLIVFAIVKCYVWQGQNLPRYSLACYYVWTVTPPLFVVGDRLSDFYIQVGTKFDSATFNPATYTQCWYQSDAIEQGETRQFTCSEDIVGRYVTINFPTTKSGALTLCEVQVYTDVGTRNRIFFSEAENAFICISH